MNREKPQEIEGNLEDLEIREKISDILKLIKKDKDYNQEDINEEEIISAILNEFNSLSKNHIAKEGFLTTLEEKIRIMVIKKMEARLKEKFLNTVGEIHKIDEKIHGKDENIKEISKAA